MRVSRHTPVALLCAVIAVLMLPNVARAASYDVWLCAMPPAAAASTEGWEPFSSHEAGALRNNCADDASTSTRLLDAELARNTQHANGAYVGWLFTAPAGTTIQSYSLWRSVEPAHGYDSSSRAWAHGYFLYHDARVPWDMRYVAEGCVEFSSSRCGARGAPYQPFSAKNLYRRTNLEIRRLFALLECTGQTSSCPPVADPGRLLVYAARIGLSDPSPPAFAQRPVGSLLDSDATLEGEHALRFIATDRGGGIARTAILVDGTPVLSRPSETGRSRCVAPYTVTVPCPLRTETTLAFDTAQLPNGTHSVQASVTDAAGNETRSEPVTVTTRNGSRPNGRGASRFVRLDAWLRARRGAPRASAVVPYGAVRTAEGRLVDAGGQPIAGAVLDVVSRLERPGAADVPAGTVTTGEDGRFSHRLGRGASRAVRFEYRAYSLDPAPVSTAAVTLGVRAGLRLTPRPRRLRNGQRVVLRGRLLGGPARKGARVTIDVLVPDARRRVPIGNVRADGRGRFRFAYRFRRTLVKARYRFQARLVAQPGYPYRSATSRPVAVVVRP